MPKHLQFINDTLRSASSKTFACANVLLLFLTDSKALTAKEFYVPILWRCETFRVSFLNCEVFNNMLFSNTLAEIGITKAAKE